MKISAEQWDVLIVTTLGSLLTAFMSSAITIALPDIGKEFAASAVLLSWIPASFLLATAVFLIPFGRLADISGRKRIFLYGIITFTAASLLSAIAGSPFWLIVFRILQGIAGAMIMSTAIAILSAVFPPNERGRAMGINVAATYIGLSAGPFLGGMLTGHFGWRSIFLFAVPFGLAIIGLIVQGLRGREWAEARNESFDITGSVFYGFSLSLLMLGFTVLPSAAGAWLLLAGIAGLAGFLARESKVPAPLLDISLFKNNTVFLFSNVAALINYSATFSVTFMLSLYLQYIKKFDPQTAGFILVVQPAMQALFSPFAGRLSDREEPRKISSAGMALTALGLFLFVFLGETTPLPLIVTGLVLLGLGFAFFSSPNTNAVMCAVDKKRYGTASGILSTMRVTGQMFSMALTIMVFSLLIGRGAIAPSQHPAFLHSVTLLFGISALLCCAGIFASLARGKVSRKPS